jgi:hypothetical protein
MVGGAVALLACPPVVHAQQPDSAGTDSLLVEVRLAGVGSVVVLARRQGDTLFLPAGPVHALAGLDEPLLGLVRVEELGQLLQVGVRWLPRQLVVELRDPFQRLPATRARIDALRAEAASRNALALETRRRGLFGGVTVDDRRETLLDLGYSLGWAFGRFARSSLTGPSWSVGANPLSPLWLTYSYRERSGGRVSARVAFQRTWLSAEYQQGDIEVSGASAIGPLVVFASSRDRFAITWRGDVDVQVGHARDRSAVRVSFGPIDPSPLSIPSVN